MGATFRLEESKHVCVSLSLALTLTHTRPSTPFYCLRMFSEMLEDKDSLWGLYTFKIYHDLVYNSWLTSNLKVNLEVIFPCFPSPWVPVPVKNTCKNDESYIRKPSVKVSFSDIILYRENPKDKNIYSNEEMNWAKSWDTKPTNIQKSYKTYKNRLHFYTLTLNNLSRQLQKHFHLQQYQKE